MHSENYHMASEFLNCNGRNLFTLLFEPVAGEAKGSVLFLPPFAEEMHRSRHTVARQARQLASTGYNVMLLDLSGCGDSGGHFRDASWELWLEDAEFAAAWLSDRYGKPITAWGLRLGALLACDLCQNLPNIDKLLLWQPVISGEQQIDQFLRFQTAGRLLVDEPSTDRAGLWSELRSGNTLEVAGYEVSSELAMGTSEKRLTNLAPHCPVMWLEVSKSPSLSLTPASQNIISAWRHNQKVQVDTACVDGEPYWRSFDATDSPELRSSTEELLLR